MSATRELGRTAFFLGILGLWGCGTDGTIALDVYVPASPDVAAPNTNVFDLAQTVKIEVLQNGKVKRTKTFDIGENTGEIGLLSFKGEVQVRVSVLTNDDPPILLGKGATGKLELSEEDNSRSLGIMVGRVQTFFPTTDSADNTIATSLSAPRVGLSATEIGNGRVLLAGGTKLNSSGAVLAGEILDSLEVYDPSTGVYTPLPVTLSAPRAFHTATVLDDGRVLLAGGLSRQTNGSIATLATAEIFDPVTCGKPFDATTCQVFPVGDGNTRLASERAGHTATLLGDGSVLFTGGFRQNATAAPEFLKTAEILALARDSLAGVFEGAGQMPEPRGLHAAALLPDGSSVLIAGGRDSGTVFDTTLVFKQGVGFVPGGTMTAKRFSHSLTPIGQDGANFLIAGGFTAINGAGLGASPTTFLDVADANGAIINGAAPLNVLTSGAVAEHSAVRLEDGRVLIAGGSLTNGNSSDQAVVVRFFQSGGFPALDPQPTEPMEDGRAKAAALGHSNGGALIFGGARFTQAAGLENLSSAEAFVADFLP